MASDDPTFLDLKSPEDARRAHRRTTAETNEFAALIAEADLDSARRLAEARPDRPAETGNLTQGRTGNAERLRKIAVGMRELAGLTDADLPWKRWADDIKTRAGQAEERFVQAQDTAENADAYGVDADEAQFALDMARADVEAFHALHATLLSKVPATPNRAARRSSRAPAAE